MYARDSFIKKYSDKHLNSMFKELSSIFADKMENYFWSFAQLSKDLVLNGLVKE